MKKIEIIIKYVSGDMLFNVYESARKVYYMGKRKFEKVINL